MLSYKTHSAGSAASLDDAPRGDGHRMGGSRIEFAILGGLLVLQFLLW